MQQQWFTKEIQQTNFGHMTETEMAGDWGMTISCSIFMQVHKWLDFDNLFYPLHKQIHSSQDASHSNITHPERQDKIYRENYKSLMQYVNITFK